MNSPSMGINRGEVTEFNSLGNGLHVGELVFRKQGQLLIGIELIPFPDGFQDIDHDRQGTKETLEALVSHGFVVFRHSGSRLLLAVLYDTAPEIEVQGYGRVISRKCGLL